MKTIRISSLPAVLTVSGLLTISNAFAIPLIVNHGDAANCDPLFVPQQVDEIGLPVGGFPPGELLASSDVGPGPPVCIPSNETGLIDPIVSITNLNAVAFTEVWYVADPDTIISNHDGFVIPAGGTLLKAFRIDTVGINTPLLFESFAADGVWSPGETWDFVIQDYFNAFGLLPSALGSIGLGSPALLSSGSIIAIPVVIPVPAAAWLFGGALAGLGVFRRRSHA